MTERYDTMKMKPLTLGTETAPEILAQVYLALKVKGYDPITQLVGYVVTGDPTYITSFNNARSMICRLERDEIVEELVRSYIHDRLDGSVG
ncbi:MAG: IreB family regulatory phosphoprotein [Clostridia bacterium]|nr:IreB family regulatory phosphoprotein [Clostridia bacterium]